MDRGRGTPVRGLRSVVPQDTASTGQLREVQAAVRGQAASGQGEAETPYPPRHPGPPSVPHRPLQRTTGDRAGQREDEDEQGRVEESEGKQMDHEAKIPDKKTSKIVEFR